MESATVNFDEMVIRFEADVYQTDYMVPGSPVWTTVEEVTVAEVEILGHDVPVSALPKALLDALCEYAPTDQPEEWG